MSVLVLELDPDLAAAVAVALHRHRAALRESGRREPAGLADLLDAATRAARHGQERPGTDTDLSVDLDDSYGRSVPDFLTPSGVAAALGRSERTIRRRCLAGDFGAFREGRDWRIPRAALDHLGGSS